jgi:hypothetical protein
MKRAILATDAILQALIGPDTPFVNGLIEKAKNREIEIVVLDFALYCALRSVHKEDDINISRFTDLMKYAQIEASPNLGPEDRESWEPTEEEKAKWRRVVLQAE